MFVGLVGSAAVLMVLALAAQLVVEPVAPSAELAVQLVVGPAAPSATGGAELVMTVVGSLAPPLNWGAPPVALPCWIDRTPRIGGACDRPCTESTIVVVGET